MSITKKNVVTKTIEKNNKIQKEAKAAKVKVSATMNAACPIKDSAKEAFERLTTYASANTLLKVHQQKLERLQAQLDSIGEPVPEWRADDVSQLKVDVTAQKELVADQAAMIVCNYGDIDSLIAATPKGDVTAAQLIGAFKTDKSGDKYLQFFEIDKAFTLPILDDLKAFFKASHVGDEAYTITEAAKKAMDTVKARLNEMFATYINSDGGDQSIFTRANIYKAKTADVLYLASTVYSRTVTKSVELPGSVREYVKRDIFKSGDAYIAMELAKLMLWKVCGVKPEPPKPEKK